MAEEYYYDEDSETAMEKVKRLFRENKVVAAGKSTLSTLMDISLTFFFCRLNGCKQDTQRIHPTSPIAELPSRAGDPPHGRGSTHAYPKETFIIHATNTHSFPLITLNFYRCGFDDCSVRRSKLRGQDRTP